MRLCRLLVMAGVAVVFVGGCSITGTWKTVKIEPPDALEHTPFQMVTFAGDGQYSATHQHGSEVRTTTGTYSWTGTRLTLTPAEGEPRVYPGSYNGFSRQLVLSHQVEDQRITARLEKVEDLPK
ncbi:MAG TPA: hypothetical protein VM243_18815 [Phycisphaerae bacterium]|nr:hypothetical protein [Phycisphaerae bacterium]